MTSLCNLTVADVTSTPASFTQPAFVPKTPEAMTYDGDGNLIADGRWSYIYDAEDRLIWFQTSADALAAQVPMTAAYIFYDYMGRRALKYQFNSAWAVTNMEYFVYQGWNLIAKINGATSGQPILQNFFWGLDLSGTMQGAGGVGGLLMTQEGSNTYLPVYDGMGNVYGMLKASDGSIAAAYEYDAFGNTLRESGTYAASNPFRYSTKYTDIESGLVYYGKRYYSPSLGRFINKDPIEESGGLNLYGFCRNNGVNSFDYLGNFRWSTLNSPDLTKDQLDRNNAYQSSFDNSHDAGSYGLATSDSIMYYGGTSTGWNAFMGDPNIMGGTPDSESRTYIGPDGNTYVVTNDPKTVPVGATVLGWGSNYGVVASSLDGEHIKVGLGGSNAGLPTARGVLNSPSSFAGLLASAGDGRYSDGSIAYLGGGEATADGKGRSVGLPIADPALVNLATVGLGKSAFDATSTGDFATASNFRAAAGRYGQPYAAYTNDGMIFGLLPNGTPTFALFAHGGPGGTGIDGNPITLSQWAKIGGLADNIYLIGCEFLQGSFGTQAAQEIANSSGKAVYVTPYPTYYGGGGQVQSGIHLGSDTFYTPPNTIFMYRFDPVH